MKESNLSFLQFDKRLFFAFLCIVTVLLIFLRKTFVESETAVFEIFAMDGKMQAFNIIYGLQYLSVPIFLLGKFTFVALGLWIATFGFGYRLTFKSLFHIAMTGQLAFVLLELVRFLYFMLVPGDPTLLDIKNFYPLSLLQAIGYEEVSVGYRFPLKMLNLFELTFWAFLITSVHMLSRKKWWKATLIVLFGYILPYLAILAYSIPS